MSNEHSWCSVLICFVKQLVSQLLCIVIHIWKLPSVSVTRATIPEASKTPPSSFTMDFLKYIYEPFFSKFGWLDGRLDTVRGKITDVGMEN